MPSNIAEGCGRQHSPDTIRFLFIARGWLFELKTQIYLATDLLYLRGGDLAELQVILEDCKKLLQGFIRYYRSIAIPSQVAEDLASYFTDNRQPPTDNQL